MVKNKTKYRIAAKSKIKGGIGAIYIVKVMDGVEGHAKLHMRNKKEMPLVWVN